MGEIYSAARSDIVASIGMNLKRVEGYPSCAPSATSFMSRFANSGI